MNPWDILSISPTVEVKKIKLAYAALIKKIRPDDDRLAFQKIREAYEQCLDHALKLEQDEPPSAPGDENPQTGGTLTCENETVLPSKNSDADHFENPESVVQALVGELIERYGDFHSRLDIAGWEAIIRRDIMQRLDVKHLLNIHLFSWVAEHPNLPGEVYFMLDGFFNWSDQQIDIARYHPERMIDFVYWKMHHAVYKHDYAGLENIQEIEYDRYIALREEGAHFLGQNDLVKAESSLGQASEIFSQDPVLLFLLGQLAERRSNDTAAVEQYGNIIDIAPDRVEGYLYRANIFLRQGKLTAACDDYQRLLEKNSENIMATKGLAQCHLKLSNYEEAKLLFELCIEKQPADFETIIALEMLTEKVIHIYETLEDKDLRGIKKLAVCYIEVKQPKKALDLLEDCPSKDSQAYLILGTALAQNNGSFERVDDIYRKSLEVAQRSGENGYQTLMARGDLLYENDHFKDAALCFRKAWKINPNNAEIADKIAWSLFYDDDIEDTQALKWADRAISMEPERYAFRKTRGHILFYLDRHGEALQELDIYIDTRYNTPFERYAKGICHYRLGQYEEAADALKMAQEMGREDSNLPYFLALSYLKTNQLDKALAQSRKYDPECWEKYNLRGVIEFRLGNLGKAIQRFQYGLGLFSDTWEYYHGLACCYIKQRAYAKAQNALDVMYGSTPENVWVLFSSTALHGLKDQWSLSLEFADQYLQACKKNGESVDNDIYYYRAMAAYQLNKMPQAVQDCEMASKSTSFRPQVIVFLSMLYYELGQIDKAIRLLADRMGQSEGVKCQALLNALRQSKASGSEPNQKIDYKAFYPDVQKIGLPAIEPDVYD